MPDLPTGTVTFLFTDIEGSTRLAAELGDAWPATLELHRTIVREAIGGRGGIEVGTEGDSFFVAFPSATDAVEAALDAQRALAAERWPAGAEIHVRMGLHSAEASVSGGSYAGVEVHRAARIGAVAHGGQVLVSDAARALVVGSLPDGLELRDLGRQTLREFEEDHLWQLVVPDLPSQFPALGSVAGTPNNLPTRLTSFLGRAQEIAEISRLLGEARLLTLTGPGGTGKTRLSLEVARGMLDAYPDGVWFVELSPITEPELVPATIAQVLGLPDRGGRSSIERLRDHIGSKRVLLVLDNFEQVVAAAAAVGELLSGAPNLTALVTSRSVLHVYGEREYPVPPLGLPDPTHLPDLATLSTYEAVALFIDRATAVKPGFAVTNENAPAVAEICVRLDGLPLAIELAAARIRILTPQAMLGRLGDRLGLLSGGGRDLPARQQTLRGAIAWSHDMLEDADRTLFACMSVFVGGARISAIERVCGRETEGEIIDAIESLVDKSLLRQAEGVGGEPRIWMLETIREFALEQAGDDGRWEDLRCRHGELFLEIAEEASRNVMGSEKREVLDRLEEDHDNLRASLTWAIETGEPEIAQRLSAALWRFWQMRGYLAEGLERVQSALALPGSRDHPAARARALDAGGGLAYWQGEMTISRALYEEEVELQRTLGDERGTAEALYSLTFTLTYESPDMPIGANREAAELLAREALEIYERLGDQHGIGLCLWAMANFGYAVREVVKSREYSLRARDIFRTAGDRFMESWAIFTGAQTYMIETPDTPRTEERLIAAEGEICDALRIFHEAGDVSGYTLALDALAGVAHHRADGRRAAVLAGAVAALERSSGTGLSFTLRGLVDFDPASIRDDPASAEAYAAGERLSAAEAVAYALREPSPVD